MLQTGGFLSSPLRRPLENEKDDLQNQAAFLRQFCNAKGIIVDQCLKSMEVALITAVKSGINYCMKFNTTIVAVNNEELSSQEELVQDMVSILHISSCRLYGLRKHKQQIEGDEKVAKELQNGN